MKHTVLCLIAAVLLGSLWYFTGDSGYTERDEMPAVFAAMQQLPLEQVDSIKLSSGDSHVLMTRDGKDWKVPSRWSYPANRTQVDKFLKAIRETENPEKRASTASSHARFELDPDKRRQIVIGGNGEGLPITLTIGKATMDGGCYLLLEGSDTVYSVKTALVREGRLYGGEISQRDWVDRSIFDAKVGDGNDDAELSELILTTPEGVIHLKLKMVEATEEKGSDGDSSADDSADDSVEESGEPFWEVIAPEQFVADEPNARSIVSRATRRLDGFNAADPSAREKYGLEPPERQVELLFANGQRVVILFGGPEIVDEGKDATGRYYAQRQGEPLIFTLQEWAREGYFKTLEELRPVGEEAPEEVKEGKEGQPAADIIPTTQPTSAPKENEEE